MTDYDEGYADLEAVLNKAYAQAAEGKGKERHAGDSKDFKDNPMFKIIDMVGEGFALGQAIKKIEESRRLPIEMAVNERLGAIVYIAASIIALENKA